MKKITAFLVLFAFIFVFPVHTMASSGNMLETEMNDNYLSADLTYDDYDNYGYISLTTDVDWWKIQFEYDGFVNFWLGDIPSGCNYEIVLYEKNGNNLTQVASSTKPGNSQELISQYYVESGTYYLKIYSSQSFSNTQRYHMRMKFYGIFGGKLAGGIYNRKYYLGVVSNLYTNPINSAVSLWNYAINMNNNGVGLDLYFTQTSSINEATIRFWGENHPDYEWVGLTRFFDNGEELDERNDLKSGTWTSNSIIYNTALAETNNSMEMKRIALHEFGHALGLSHVPYNDRVMYPIVDLITAIAPSNFDKEMVEFIYQ